MPVNQTPLSAQEIDALFVSVPPSAPETFELALVLGGTVSAGSYTAGAVDFLIEALDCWTQPRDKGDPAAPPHKLVLKIIAGTSGGGVNAAIAARALAYDFPHVIRPSPHPEQGTGDPFYDLWVNRLGFDGFLDTSDIALGNLASLLCGKPIDEAADFIAGFTAPARRARSYVPMPLTVFLTLTNLCGVPYRTDLGNQRSESFVDHADHGRFALVYPGQSLTAPRPDELVVGFDGTPLPQLIDWQSFGQFARATCAFPLGFPPRALVRPMEHHRYRVVVLPSAGDGPGQVVARVPDWDALIPMGQSALPDDYHFLTVDGGATDNEPIELARTALAGVLGRNPREADQANRAVLLIDPFAGEAALGPTALGKLTDTVTAIVSTMIQQTRYDSEDLLLAADESVFSRFMITPERDGVSGGDAIASDGLGAFLGFACPAFMRHDYLLGRANCQAFLRSTFMLDAGNPVFAGWTAPQRARFGQQSGGKLFLPLVPLIGDAALPQETDPWPQGALDPERFRDGIEARFKAVVEFEGTGGFLSSTAAWMLAHLGESKVTDMVVNAMKAALQQKGLA